MTKSEIQKTFQCVCESSEQHPESPERLQFLLTRLRDAGLLQDCLQVEPRDNERSNHGKDHFQEDNVDDKANAKVCMCL